jgi:transcriptional regulator with XRE-family HTH domain
MDDIPHRIQIIMTELGLGPEEFAESIRLTRPAILYWLSGKTRPSWKNAQKIQNTHDYSMNWIMTGLGNKRAGNQNGGVVGMAGDRGHPPPGFQDAGRQRRRSDRTVSTKKPPLKRA